MSDIADSSLFVVPAVTLTNYMITPAVHPSWISSFFEFYVATFPSQIFHAHLAKNKCSTAAMKYVESLMCCHTIAQTRVARS